MCAVIQFVLVMYMSVNQDCLNFIALDDAEKKIILFIYLCLKNVYFRTVKVFAPQNHNGNIIMEKSALVIVVISNVDIRKQYL